MKLRLEVENTSGQPRSFSWVLKDPNFSASEARLLEPCDIEFRQGTAEERARYNALISDLQAQRATIIVHTDLPVRIVAGHEQTPEERRSEADRQLAALRARFPQTVIRQRNHYSHEAPVSSQPPTFLPNTQVDAPIPQYQPAFLPIQGRQGAPSMTPNVITPQALQSGVDPTTGLPVMQVITGDQGMPQESQHFGKPPKLGAVTGMGVMPSDIPAVDQRGFPMTSGKEAGMSADFTTQIAPKHATRAHSGFTVSPSK